MIRSVDVALILVNQGPTTRSGKDPGAACATCRTALPRYEIERVKLRQNGGVMKKSFARLACLAGLGYFCIPRRLLARARPRRKAIRTSRCASSSVIRRADCPIRWPGSWRRNSAIAGSSRSSSRTSRAPTATSPRTIVAKSTGDGYTLLVTDNSTTAINPFLYAKMPFDAEKDLIPVAMVARAPLFLAVHSSVPANTFQELVALVKSKPASSPTAPRASAAPITCAWSS